MNHAYLIMIHNNYEQVKLLLRALDSSYNDFFVHIDAKSTFSQDEKESFKRMVKHSELVFVDRGKVSWGGYSQINAEITLLKAATQRKKYDRYHLLSGACIPLKAKEELLSFFKEYQDIEFVDITSHEHIEHFQSRIRYYWFFQDAIGNARRAVSNKQLLKIILLIIQRSLIFVQKIMKVDRRNQHKNMKFYAGSNWFSITDELARYVLGQEKWIKKAFRNTINGDEMFLQTVLMNSPFRDRLFYGKNSINSCEANQRFVDWKRGDPYIFRFCDYHELIAKKICFARKFDINIDAKIIEKLYSEIHNLTEEQY